MLDANGRELHLGDIVRLKDPERASYDYRLPDASYVLLADNTYSGNRCRIRAMQDFKWGYSTTFNELYGERGFVVYANNVIKDTFMQHVLEALANDLPGQER